MLAEMFKRASKLIFVALLVTMLVSIACTPTNASATSARPFAKNSFWNAPLPPVTPIDPRSDIWVQDIRAQIKRYYGHAFINTTSNTATVYTVSRNTPTVPVKFTDCQNRGTQTATAFTNLMTAVPIPNSAMPSPGLDSEMIIWQPSKNKLWEFWKTSKREDGWYACWGGRIDNVRSSSGVFPKPYGVAATGLSLLGGMVRIEELQAGEINHAIDFSIVNTRRTVFSWPANRTDGTIASVTMIPQGQRFRLDPTLDVESLDLTPVGKMMARAIQKYGMVLRDRSGSVNFYAENPLPFIQTGAPNPYKQIFEGRASYDLLRGFPWSRLQALPLDYGKPNDPLLTR